MAVKKGQENKHSEHVSLFTTGSLVHDLQLICGEWLKRWTTGSELELRKQRMGWKTMEKSKDYTSGVLKEQILLIQEMPHA